MSSTRFDHYVSGALISFILIQCVPPRKPEPRLLAGLHFPHEGYQPAKTSSTALAMRARGTVHQLL
jgi:hypothetical protein